MSRVLLGNKSRKSFIEEWRIVGEHLEDPIWSSEMIPILADEVAQRIILRQCLFRLLIPDRYGTQPLENNGT